MNPKEILVQVTPPRAKVPEMALTLMLIGILVPTAMYSFRLSSPSPAELLVAVSIALFASVLFLWIMDATGLMPFRAAWISKAVYGAAITSILGTSVAVYKDFFYAHKYPFDGAWQVALAKASDPTHPVEFSLVLSYSESGERYWGYSNLISTSLDPSAPVWAEAVNVSPKPGIVRLRLQNHDGSKQVIEWVVSTDQRGKFIRSKTPSSGMTIELLRPD